MSESAFYLVVNIVVGIEIFLYAVRMAVFFYPFMAGKREQKKSRFKKFLIILLYAAGRLLKRKTMKLHIKELCCLLLVPITGILL